MISYCLLGIMCSASKTFMLMTLITYQMSGDDEGLSCKDSLGCCTSTFVQKLCQSSGLKASVAVRPGSCHRSSLPYLCDPLCMLPWVCCRATKDLKVALPCLAKCNDCIHSAYACSMLLATGCCTEAAILLQSSFGMCMPSVSLSPYMQCWPAFVALLADAAARVALLHLMPKLLTTELKAL